MLNSKRSGSDAIAWWIVALGAAVAIPWLIDTHPRLEPLARQIFPSARTNAEGVTIYKIGALAETLKFTLAGMFFAFVFGVLLGLMRSAKRLWVRLPASIYIEAVRGVPLLVILFCTYYGLNRKFELFGGYVFHPGPFLAATAGLVMCYAAYTGEIIRSGIETIPRELLEAAYLEGGHAQVALKVALPLAARKTFPALINEFVALLKDSALISAVGVYELTLAAKNHATASFRYFEAYALIALVYLVITLVLSKIARMVEKRWDVDY